MVTSSTYRKGVYEDGKEETPQTESGAEACPTIKTGTSAQTTDAFCSPQSNDRRRQMTEKSG
jgi:hypothetical protein